jgi:hypothetical protein
MLISSIRLLLTVWVLMGGTLLVTHRTFDPYQAAVVRVLGAGHSRIVDFVRSDLLMVTLFHRWLTKLFTV